jgi:S1-C subfamily serine protease
MHQPSPVAIRRGLFVLLLVLAFPTTLHAQGTRADMIQQAMAAYDDFESERASTLLWTALDPATGAPDDAWATGVQLMAQMLIEEGEETLAAAWLRWAVRQWPELPVDRATFLPEVIAAIQVARSFVGTRSAGDRVTRTRWDWPDRVSTGDQGTLRIEPGAIPIRGEIQGVGEFPAGRSLTLAPGSYRIEATAEGYEGAVVTREVLPGVTTSLVFDLATTAVAEATLADSVLPEAVRSLALQRVARLSVHRFGVEPACAAGAVVSVDGLLLTTYRAIRGAERIEATLPDGQRLTEGITAAYDVDDDVALLKLPATFTSPLQATDEVEGGQFVWAVGYPGCGAVTVEGMRMTAERSGVLQLSDTLPGDAQGGPVIDQSGRVVGLGTGVLTAVAAERVGDRIQTANANVLRGALLTPEEVARQERHIYGSIQVTSDVTGVVARITPIDSWLWAGTAQMGTLPLTFTAPMGRYRVEVLSQGEVQRAMEFSVQPDLAGQLQIPVAAAMAEAEEGGGGFPIAIVLGGVAAAGAAVALMAAGGGGDGGGGGGTPTPTPTLPGSITISIPNR